MATGQLNGLVRHIRRMALGHDAAGMTDGELLKRFVGQRDEAAFAALVRRFGPLVLGVCRRVLHHRQDAEDAFQATFLVLLHKAGSIAPPELVGNWLYGVAYFTAKNAKASAVRRRARERQVTEMPRPHPVAEEDGLQELRPLLDEELSRLPEKYRVPIVLCELHGKSRREVARHLGCPEGTLSSRLARARQILKRRLSKRGVALSAGSLAVALSRDLASASVPAPLMASTIKTALLVAASTTPHAGVVSAPVAALTQGVLKTMFLAKLKTASLVLLTVSFVTAVGLMTHQVFASREKEALATEVMEQKTAGAQTRASQLAVAAAKLDSPASISIRGRVLDPDGKPFAGAKLYLSHAGSREQTYSVRATSGDDGRFDFTFAKSELNKTDSNDAVYQILASTLGHGCDWVKADPADKELTVRLVKDMPINGHILDPDGRPVVGAKITVTGIFAPKGDELAGYLEAIRKGEDYKYAFAKSWAGPLPGQTAALTTGEDGRFKLSGVGRERVVHLHLEGPAIAAADLTVMTRAAEQVGYVHGASFDFLAVASRPIRGVVRDKATGKPLAGLSIEAGSTRVVTDREGRYELLGLAKSPTYSLTVKPRDGLYFERRAELKDTAGLEPLTGNIDLVRGEVTVRGKVTDKATGKPIARARVYYYPLAFNPHVNKKLDGAWWPRSEAATGQDGSYVLTVLPGQGELGVTGPNPDAYMTALVTPKEIKEFFKAPVFGNQLDRAIGGNMASFIVEQPHALELLEPEEKQETLVKNVALEPAKFLTMKGRVVDPDGKPITGVTVRGLTGGFDEKTLTGDEFSVERIDPRVNRQLAFYREDQKLGFFLKDLNAKTPEPLIIKLQPCGSATGRFVDTDGQPLAESRIDIGAVAHGPVAPRHQWVMTDKEGRFRFEGLVPGYAYPLTRIDVPNIFAEVVVEPGKTKDVGDIKLIK